MIKRTFTLSLCLILLALMTIPAVAATRHIVQRGETLYAIARRYGVSVTAIAQANNIVNPNLIFVNQALTIPDGSPPPSTTPSPPTPPSSPSGATYTVQRGDTLYRIALRFGTTIQAIADANGLVFVNRIYVGQTLIIPGSSQPPQPPIDQSTPTPPPPAPTALPPTATPPTNNGNLLQNPSFENGWYNQNGISELQLPHNWRFEYDTGNTGFGSQPWDVWVRPETRVLSRDFLPPNEHPLFIYSGNYTVKVFKGNGAISYRLLQEITLQPGTYRLTINAFPDLVTGYQNGQKIFATDPLAGEIRVIGNGDGGWQSVVAGQRNTLARTFTISQTQRVTVGAAIRGRFAINNNGWFLDEWTLSKVN